MQPDEEFLKRLRAAFVAEAKEQVDTISGGLSRLAESDEAERGKIVESNFRETHNLKGSARAVNLLDLESVCQLMEDVFAQLKKHEREVSVELTDQLHEVVDGIASFLTAFERDNDFDGSEILGAALTKITDVTSHLEHSVAVDEAVSTQQSPSESNEKNIDTQSKSNEKNIDTQSESNEKNIDTQSVAKPIPKYSNPLLDDFVFPSATEEPAAPEPPKKLAPMPEAPKEAVRISAAKLDELLMRAEDMLSLKIMSRQHNQDLSNVGFKFDSYNKEWTKIYSDVRSARQLIDRDTASPDTLVIETVLGRVLEFLDQQQQQLSALSSQLTSLQTSSLNDFRSASGTVDTFLENTKKLLMMPASTMLELMPKLVRDLARELGKEVDLTIKGSSIQLDKRVLNQLKDPLIHILRNSIDHGLERPEERLASGKSRRGTISIQVQHNQGNLIELTITDDGGGINIDRVKEIGLEKQLISEDAAKTMTDEEATELIFQSSFSTSRTISEISGRGLGMAIARENIVNIGGKLHVESKRGQGTTFRITLPMTIGTFRGVLIKCGSETLVVPTADFDRVVRLKPSQVQSDKDSTSIKVENKTIPLIPLHVPLDLPESARKPHHLIIVLKTGESIHAFEVDDVLEEQEILVKKVSKPIVRVRNVAGVTILGNGKPAVILNVKDLIKTAQKTAKASTPEVREPTIAAKQQRILVVDDTITARILMKNILESAGYAVKTAKDGVEALKTLNREDFDMVVTDIEMPNMNGIELTSAVRAESKCKEIPIILVTSMTDQESRDKGTAAGANAFFVKSSFDQNNLVDVIKQLI
ncbi:MAG TPA: response regulator [Drouetiella sp.]